MALFESKESKEEKKARKIAEAEQKQAEKDFALLQKYGLTGLMELGITFGGGNDRDIQKNQLYYQRAILEQNFIIIRQLDRISKLLSDR